jgi:DNA repair protein RecN (Recombination protein N)
MVLPGLPRKRSMLSELVIHNLVIVEHARLCPGVGLTVVSGETGAGKSLLLDALEMVSGERAQGAVVGPWSDAATVTAVFHPDADRCERVLAACSVPPADGQYILRRKIGAAGRSQAWINDVPVTLAALRSAAEWLIEIHSQHEPQRLSDVAVQMELLDGFAGTREMAAEYVGAHRRVGELAQALAEIDGGSRESVKELDYTAFQLREIEALQPKRGEFAELEARHALMTSAGSWRELADEAVQSLTEEERSAGAILARLSRRLAEAPDPKLAEAARACQQALEAVRDASAWCAEASERLDADPGEISKIEERLNAYHELRRKHGDGDDELFSVWEALSRRLQELSTVGERRSATAEELARSIARRAEIGAALAKQRASRFARLAKSVHQHLSDLGMPKATLSLAAQELAEPGPLGSVHQEFLVRTNPGMPEGRLGDVASGGESARIALSLAESLAQHDRMPVLVFDEVDSGVGGRLGAIIGAKLAHLARDRTVLAVTHTPQLAAAAQRQYLVRKRQGDKETRVSVVEVSGEERLREISDMLGGGKAALDQAKALLSGAAH